VLFNGTWSVEFTSRAQPKTATDDLLFQIQGTEGWARIYQHVKAHLSASEKMGVSITRS
jgi:hypothetical protein